MAGLEDIIGGMLGGAQAQGGSAQGFDPGAMAQNMNKVMMVAGPLIAMLARAVA